jgi:hypothetical protein
MSEPIPGNGNSPLGSSPVRRFTGAGLMNFAHGNRVVDDVNRKLSKNGGELGAKGKTQPQTMVAYMLAGPVSGRMGWWHAKEIVGVDRTHTSNATVSDIGAVQASVSLLVIVPAEIGGARQMRVGDIGVGLVMSEDVTSKMPIVMQAAAGDEPRYGKVVTGGWSSGSYITVTPCTIDGDEFDTLDIPVAVKKDASSYTMANSTSVAAGTVLPYTVGSDGGMYVFGHDPITRLVDFQIDTATKKFQVKRYDTWGTFHGTDSAWLDAHTGNVCE